ncbi:MAG: V-type ATP synthase subunit K [Candidatus Heimdallarchaeaceae archaeon]
MRKNDLIIGLLAIVALIILTAKGTLAAEEIPLGNLGDMRPIGAALAIGLAGIGSALGMGSAGSAGIGALVEKPEIFGKIFLFIVLIEAVAIYGLLVAILLIF